VLQARDQEDGELAEIRLGDEEAEDGAAKGGARGSARRRKPGLEAPAAGGERGAREVRRRREAEQGVLDVAVLE
jgi:hypothetical protein